MSKLHDVVKNLYTKVIKPLFALEIQADDGKWNRITSVNVTSPTKFFKVKTCKHELLCTESHILIDENGNEVFGAQALGKRVKTDLGIEEVISVEETEFEGCAYDVSLVEDSNHLYFANGFLSHNCVIMDEAAFVPNNIASKVFESIYPVISSSKNSQFIMVSTPNGADHNNLYYDIWCKANSKEKNANAEGWKPFRFDWWDVPGRDEQWKLNTIASIGKHRFDQEFGNEFQSSSTTNKLLADDKIEQYRRALSAYKAANIQPKRQKIISQDEKELFEFEMWHEFEPTHAYIASMDISEGVGQDASVLYIWDVTDIQNIVMCAKFSDNRISLVQFAYVARKILALYGDPFLTAERNGVSAGTLDSLRITYGYDNIAKENKKNEPGIYSHLTVKERACQWAKQLITAKDVNVTLYDKDLIDEMEIFCKKNCKGSHLVYAALPGPNSHDDHMMAFIWMLYLLNPDIIDRYFIVCQTFVDQFGNVYPKTLQPLESCSSERWQKIKADPLYKKFLEYKEESAMKHTELSYLERLDCQLDPFKYSARPPANASCRRDRYFGDDDGPSWNSSPTIDANWRPAKENSFCYEQERLQRAIRCRPAYFI